MEQYWLGKEWKLTYVLKLGNLFFSFNFFGGGLETGNIVVNKIHMAPVIIEPRD